MNEWSITVQVRMLKKKGMLKFRSKTMCTHSKWANEQTLKTELHITLLIILTITGLLPKLNNLCSMPNLRVYYGGGKV